VNARKRNRADPAETRYGGAILRLASGRLLLIISDEPPPALS
jgi:hypothetical protein